MIKTNKRGGLQFGWIFAVIVGAVILFLAFYFIGQLMTESRIEKGTVATRSLDIVITPLSSYGDIGATTAYLIELPTASRINIECEYETILGSNSILLLKEGQTKSGAGHPKRLYDKYLFAGDINVTEKKKYQSLTKSVYMPWRVADLTMIWPADRKYCFVHTNWNDRGIKRIKEELGDIKTGLNISSISFVKTEGECDSKRSTKVCFYEGQRCDIHVPRASREGAGTVKKDDETLHYAGDALMYAAIFSDPGLYKCNLNRIGKRLDLEIEVYESKSIELGKKIGCSQIILNTLKGQTGTLAENAGLGGLWSAAITTKKTNDYALCKLF